MSARDLPAQRKPASVPVSGGVFGARAAASVCGSRERERTRPAARAFRVPPTNSLSPTLTRPATRVPALRAARNFPTGSSYGIAGNGPKVRSRRLRKL
jgi:hypothetical protein